jgi:hypothetical protein
VNRARHDADITGRLVREKSHELFGEPPEGGGIGGLIPQNGELVSDKGMVDDA